MRRTQAAIRMQARRHKRLGWCDSTARYRLYSRRIARLESSKIFPFEFRLRLGARRHIRQLSRSWIFSTRPCIGRRFFHLERTSL
jgi:hypothetical protein